MTLQLAAAVSNFSWLETMMTDVPWRGDVIREDVRLENGMMRIPDRPGLGVELNEAACAEHPYKAYELRHYKGTLTDIRPANARPFFSGGANEV
jgi:galactonate dehydratase